MSIAKSIGSANCCFSYLKLVLLSYYANKHVYFGVYVIAIAMQYNPKQVAAFYDTYSEKEWHRLTKDPAALVSFYIHQHYLQKYVRARDLVLELGAGAGRFTIELAKLGASIAVGDISAEQLRLNQKYVGKYKYEAAIASRLQLDIIDLSIFEANTFDTIVCYGGALSYVLDEANTALTQMRRVLKPEGHLLVSVMSLIGTTQKFFESVTEEPDFTQLVYQVNQNGLLDRSESDKNSLKMYRAKELRQLLESNEFEVVKMSASNCLSLNRNEFLEQKLQNTDAWSDFLNWELDFCGSDGCLDGGTHIIAVAKNGRK